MFSARRWLLPPPRHSFRALSTRNIPQGPRGSLRRSRSISRPTSRVLPQSKRSAGQSEHGLKKESNDEPTKVEAVSHALSAQPDAENTLLTPVHIPQDPNGVLKETHPAMNILDNSAIVVQRQLEMMNVLMGFEQANRYVIMDPHGNHIGYLAEQEHGIGNTLARQMLKTHRSFTTHVFDRHEKEVLRFHRPFSWISSRIRVYDAVGTGSGTYTTSGALQGTSVQAALNQSATQISSIPLNEMRIIGAAEQQWAPLRRKYNLFLARDLSQTPASAEALQLASGELPLSNSKALQVVEGDQRETGFMQFARVDEPFLSWDFTLRSEDNRLVGSVNRNFGGFARELFTDTGVYALRMDAAALSQGPSNTITKTDDQPVPALSAHPGMTLDQRAVMLATAVSIDFDYFSRHSGAGGGMGFFPMWFPMWGGEAAAGGAAAEAGAVGAAGEAGIASEAGAAARGLGAAEVTGAGAAGAGTMAGYEAMHRGRDAASQQEAGQEMDPQSPTSGYGPSDQSQPHVPAQEDVWGETQNPWGTNEPNTANPDDDFWGTGGQGRGGEDGGGDGDGWGDWF
ncbi:Scramblase-domain-containing protein [Delitschia confertaspora ATCC 74209]|uniref:Scramblase-domain-containing protein n=1 Tax=Delitschia confertaspora ATCC 74209 TaxID=1513339 RepID=A0A9P4JKH9_9PLEO|nr:Scramblase-domain-containing protein [Delitschia confertaspora ATCC 74209]